jgi:XTP/dITP diphosphohydrolase
MKKLVFATNNEGKLAELRDLVPGIEIVPGPDLDVVEDGETFAANAEKKARAYLQATGLPALADDSGLCVDALSGRPGVHSKRYGNDDADRIAKLLAELGDNPRRFARFVCALCLALPGGDVERAEGTCEGIILHAPRGTGGFGYDPIFLVTDAGKSMAELTRREKAKVSHRGHAMRMLLPRLMAR